MHIMKENLSHKGLIKILREPIEQRRLVKFYYESKSGKKEWRTIRPYMLISRGTNIEFVGLPLEELNKPLFSRQPGHYITTKLDTSKFEVLSEQFDDPGAPRGIVVKTQGKVICRFIYDDENEKEIRSRWVKIDDL